jgi:ribosomal protein S18 acetylase RimI-like enzyme
MSVSRYDDPDAFISAIATRLAHHPARNAMFRAWTAGLRRQGAAGQCYLAVWRDGHRASEAFQSGEGPIVLGDDVDGARAFARDIVSDHPHVGGVVGSAQACQAFATEWNRSTGRIPRLRFRMRNHMLGTLAMPKLPSGRARIAEDDDFPWLLESQIAFAGEANLPDSRARLVDLTRTRQSRGQYRIWQDGERVAFAGWSEGGEGAARIAPVYTVPGHRRCGYAAALVAELVGELRAAARPQIFLVTDVANDVANALYARLGFRALDEFHHFDLVEP